MEYKRELEEQIEQKRRAQLFEVQKEKEEDLKYEMKINKQLNEISVESDKPIQNEYEGKISFLGI